MRGALTGAFTALILLAAPDGASQSGDSPAPAVAEEFSAAADAAPAGAGASASLGAEGASDLPPEVEAILSAPSEEGYPGQEECISRHRLREIDVLDERHLVFRMHRKQLYLVQFQHRCPGLRRNDPVVYESLNSMSICRHDSVRALLPFGFGSSGEGPPCFIPGFQQISEEQLAALKEALRQR